MILLPEEVQDARSRITYVCSGKDGVGILSNLMKNLGRTEPFFLTYDKERG